jgi:hypothetical protein
MKKIIFLMALLGCGGDDGHAANGSPDAAAIDAAVDAPLSVDCMSYCDEMTAGCKDANAQYTSTQCMKDCASFPVAASTINDQIGDTLGCRLHFAIAATTAVKAMANATEIASDCAYASPAGDLLTAAKPAYCSGGDVCASFCALEIQACGSLSAPLAGNPRDQTNNPIYQFRDMDDCMSSCDTYVTGQAMAHAYSTSAKGDSLACRLAQAADAAVSVANAMNECPSTAIAPTGACAGTATP